VLVDEFQDTDPVQWDIMRRAFGGGLSTPGPDRRPKQAIYAFRGADVYAYLGGARAAASARRCDVNWRSDQGLIDAYDALFGGARLGHEGSSTAASRPRRTARACGRRARRCGCASCRDEGGADAAGLRAQRAAREWIARDSANDLVGLLESGARCEGARSARATSRCSCARTARGAGARRARRGGIPR
jgi:exodeoxyribonuclease V beta subunit